MGLLFRSLAMILLLILYPAVKAQLNDSSTRVARALDALLQDYAYRTFVRPRTGIPYDGILPSNLTGIEISAMRLRTGSLRTRGVPSYKEFRIPVGVITQPYVERLVLVYQKLGNLSRLYYPISGYAYLAPVLGLLAYDASDLSAKNLRELDIEASGEPISIEFGGLGSFPTGSVPRCVWFDLQGVMNFTSVVSGNRCLTFQQGHFSIVIQSNATNTPSISPIPPPPPRHSPPPSTEAPNHKGKNSKVWIIVGSVVGGFALLVLLGLLIIWVWKYNKRKKMNRMERAAEVGEALHMASVGNTKAPSAMVTRTQPTLETEYVP